MKPTRSYATSAGSLSNVKFDAIVRDARDFLKPNRSRNKTTDATEVINIDDIDDKRATLIDNSDESDEECMSLSLSLYLFRF